MSVPVTTNKCATLPSFKLYRSTATYIGIHNLKTPWIVTKWVWDLNNINFGILYSYSKGCLLWLWALILYMYIVVTTIPQSNPITFPACISGLKVDHTCWPTCPLTHKANWMWLTYTCWSFHFTSNVAKMTWNNQIWNNAIDFFVLGRIAT